jgi:hypothetical protein
MYHRTFLISIKWFVKINILSWLHLNETQLKLGLSRRDLELNLFGSSQIDQIHRLKFIRRRSVSVFLSLSSFTLFFPLLVSFYVDLILEYILSSWFQNVCWELNEYTLKVLIPTGKKKSPFSPCLYQKFQECIFIDLTWIMCSTLNQSL